MKQRNPETIRRIWDDQNIPAQTNVVAAIEMMREILEEGWDGKIWFNSMSGTVELNEKDPLFHAVMEFLTPGEISIISDLAVSFEREQSDGGPKHLLVRKLKTYDPEIHSVENPEDGVLYKKAYSMLTDARLKETLTRLFPTIEIHYLPLEELEQALHAEQWGIKQLPDLIEVPQKFTLTARYSNRISPVEYNLTFYRDPEEEARRERFDRPPISTFAGYYMDTLDKLLSVLEREYGQAKTKR